MIKAKDLKELRRPSPTAIFLDTIEKRVIEAELDDKYKISISVSQESQDKVLMILKECGYYIEKDPDSFSYVVSWRK